MPMTMRTLRRVLQWLALGGLAGVMAGVLLTAGLYLYIAPQLPAVERLQDVHMQQPLRIYAANGELMATYGAKYRLPVDIEQVPQPFRNAFIAAEDDRFYEHPGVDWMGIARAAWHLLRTGRKTQGGSTITMQVARNFFLSYEKTYIRKIREIFLALQIHAALTKDEVLELYLNKIYLGEGAYGIAAAARTYYGKGIDELRLDQMATIAGLPKAPSYYNPAEHPQRARVRRDYVLHRMYANDMIGRQALERALARPVRASERAPRTKVEAMYAADLARQRAEARLGEPVYTRGYSIYTTVVPREQRAANKAVRSGLRAYARRHGYLGPIGHHDAGGLPAAARLGAGGGTRPAPAATAEQAREALDKRLAQYEPAGSLRPAVVLRVEADGALVYRREGGLARIPWQAMQWAAPRQADGDAGPPPQAPADVLAAGDVVHVAGRPGDARVRLAQRPRVQGALVALDPHDGAIRALVGGFDFAHSRFNRAIQAHRQPGSTFKPFVYSAALAHGFTPATLVNDAPVVFDAASLGGAWRPQNYSGRVYGPTRLREGLVHSRNLVSIRVLRRIGVPDAIDFVQRFGFSAAQLPRDLTLALGSASVTPLQMARAYAVFANMGHLVEPYLITRIADAAGAVVYRANPAIVCDAGCRRRRGATTAADGGRRARARPVAAGVGVGDRAMRSPAGDADVRYAPRVITRENAYLMRSLLRDVARRGTAQGTRVLGRDDIGAKTGTTDRQRDAWFSGFNSSIVATTWVGFDEPRSLGRHETGARAALPIWLDFMSTALADTPERWPPMPAGIVGVRIDPQTGRYAAPGNEDAVFEIFRARNAPEPREGRPDGRSPGHLF